MNRRIIITGLLLLVGALSLRASNDPNEFYVKVSGVSEKGQEMEARFVTPPDNMRLVCTGDTVNKFNVGDYVKVELKNNGAFIGKTPCVHIRWYFQKQGVKKP